jgi:hypothetical protein
VAGLNDGAAKGDREVRLPPPGAPKSSTLSGLGEKATGGQLTHQPLIDRRLEFEIEVLERLHRREVRDL